MRQLKRLNSQRRRCLTNLKAHERIKSADQLSAKTEILTKNVTNCMCVHQPIFFLKIRNNLIIKPCRYQYFYTYNPFKFTARLNRPFDQENDVVKLDLSFGPDPCALDGTRILVQVGEKPGRNWFLTIEEVSGDNLTCLLHIPANAMIGRYKTAIYLQTDEDEVRVSAVRFSSYFLHAKKSGLY
jgi:hypothetical protein